MIIMVVVVDDAMARTMINIQLRDNGNDLKKGKRPSEMNVQHLSSHYWSNHIKLQFL